MTAKIIVLKFGSSVLRDRSDLPAVVHEIYRWIRSGHSVLAVVSALAGHTEELLSEARNLGTPPEEYAMAELLATGERRTAALLGIALDRAGIAGRVIDPRDICLTASGTPLEADPVAVDHLALRRMLQAHPVVVIPGFFGYNTEHRVVLFGRGGSDFSAAFLSASLGQARCRLIKDVDGVYDQDPAVVGTLAQRYATLHYTRAAAVSTRLIQPKAIAFLQQRTHLAEVAALAAPYETHIQGDHTTRVSSVNVRPLRVVLLGLGTIGGGVYQRLMQLPAHFEVMGALVRTPEKYIAQGMNPKAVTSDAESLFRVRPDVVVELLPGLEPARQLVNRALVHGIHVVTANKQVMADEGPLLAALAKRHHVELRFSAAVGGAAPFLETLMELSRTLEIRSLSGVLNGTSNFILDRWRQGLGLDEAVKEAQALGFAEADPTEDLSGRDAERKLRLLARAAFGREANCIVTEPLNPTTLLRFERARKNGESVRAVTSAHLEGDAVVGAVGLEALPDDHPLARTREEWNTLVIGIADGSVRRVNGRGAGRWPTTESVMGDLMELRRAHILETMARSRDDTILGRLITPRVVVP